ncbi:hypothetical protein AZ048_000865 [Escherichia coli]|nr:hypothetical protein AZ048_000865 [Escherichia coli]
MHSGRFIPAGAGNSPSASSPALDISVYPRWRGELWFTHATSERVDGLSPLARGTQGRRYPRSATPRFIPAGAGNSVSYTHLDVYKRQSRYCAAPTRFIPAGAGNSLNLMMAVTAWTVYPRWRGELCKHNLLLINDFLSQSQSTNFTVSHKQHIHYVKEYFIH